MFLNWVGSCCNFTLIEKSLKGHPRIFQTANLKELVCSSGYLSLDAGSLPGRICCSPLAEL